MNVWLGRNKFGKHAPNLMDFANKFSNTNRAAAASLIFHLDMSSNLSGDQLVPLKLVFQLRQNPSIPSTCNSIINFKYSYD